MDARTLITWLCLADCLGGLSAGAAALACNAEAGEFVPVGVEPSVYAPMDRTYRLLLRIAFTAYLDHLRDEPRQAAVVCYFYGLLDAWEGREESAQKWFHKCIALDSGGEYAQRARCWLQLPTETLPGPMSFELVRAGKLKQVPAEATPGNQLDLVHEAVRAAAVEDRTRLKVLLDAIGTKPQETLRRTDLPQGSETAECELFDPALLWLYAQAAGVSGSHGSALNIQRAVDRLMRLHKEIADLRDRMPDGEMSLGRFVRQYRAKVRELGHLYWTVACSAVDRNGALSRRLHDARLPNGLPLTPGVCLRRALEIDEALFAPDMRGGIECVEHTLLSELGDIYAKVGRFDLLLRYVYSSAGLPARYPPARIIASLAYIAEGMRLAAPQLLPEPVAETPRERISDILLHGTPSLPPTREATTSGIRWLVLSAAAFLAAGFGAIGLVLLRRRHAERKS